MLFSDDEYLGPVLSVFVCLRPAHSGAVVSWLGEGPGGVRPAGGPQGHLDPPPRHRAAGRRQR